MASLEGIRKRGEGKEVREGGRSAGAFQAHVKKRRESPWKLGNRDIFRLGF